jgi:hypothetical protein
LPTGSFNFFVTSVQGSFDSSRGWALSAEHRFPAKNIDFPRKMVPKICDLRAKSERKKEIFRWIDRESGVLPYFSDMALIRL